MKREVTARTLSDAVSKFVEPDADPSALRHVEFESRSTNSQPL